MYIQYNHHSRNPCRSLRESYTIGDKIPFGKVNYLDNPLNRKNLDKLQIQYEKEARLQSNDSAEVSVKSKINSIKQKDIKSLAREQVALIPDWMFKEFNILQIQSFDVTTISSGQWQATNKKNAVYWSPQQLQLLSRHQIQTKDFLRDYPLFNIDQLNGHTLRMMILLYGIPGKSTFNSIWQNYKITNKLSFEFNTKMRWVTEHISDGNSLSNYYKTDAFFISEEYELMEIATLV